MATRYAEIITNVKCDKEKEMQSISYANLLAGVLNGFLVKFNVIRASNSCFVESHDYKYQIQSHIIGVANYKYFYYYSFIHDICWVD